MLKLRKKRTAAQNLKLEKLKLEVYRRDHGRCTLCGLNIADLAEAIEYVRRHFYDAKEGWNWSKDPVSAFAQFLFALNIRNYGNRRLWEADHITPSSHGGTDELENLRLLCWRCHKKETKRVIYERNR